MFYIIPVFILMPLILMGLMIFLPFIIGKRIPPSFTKEKTKILNISKDELYKLLTNYENYPLWMKYLYQVKTHIHIYIYLVLYFYLLAFLVK